MRRLVWAFAGHTCHIFGISCHRSFNISFNKIHDHECPSFFGGYMEWLLKLPTSNIWGYLRLKLTHSTKRGFHRAFAQSICFLHTSLYLCCKHQHCSEKRLVCIFVNYQNLMVWPMYKRPHIQIRSNIVLYSYNVSYCCVCVFSDCGSPSADTGYVIDSSTGTTLDSTASLSCHADYTGSPSDIVCELTGWSTQSGCTRGKKWWMYLILSHNIATGDTTTPLFKTDNPLVVYAFSML